MRDRRTGIAALLLAGALAVSACGGDSGAAGVDEEGGGASETIDIVGFAVPEAANKAIAEAWNETDAGRGVRFTTSYGASGDQSRAVVEGLDADYVHFSVASDVTRLVDEGLVAEDWDVGDNKGVVSSSIVVLAVRPGNPEGVRGWDDLVEPGIEIVTPNPASSGAARWNALAAWGHISANGGTDAEAEEFVTELFANVVALPNSGRDATTQFLGGTGDVLLAYENEAILARQNGEELDWVVPETTIRIENPGAVLIDATRAHKEVIFSWLSGLSAQRASNIVPALEAAVSLRPDAIFVLSSGATDPALLGMSPEAVLERLDRLNPKRPSGDRSIVIQTIQVLEDDPAALLRRIAHAHGGESGYKFISRDDLARQLSQDGDQP